MKKVTLYHNPRCSKSRQALAWLKEQNHTITVIEYLKNPLSHATLETLAKQLSTPFETLFRPNEAEYKALGKPPLTLELLLEHPKLMQRPIAVHRSKAVIARPTEALETLFS